MKKRNKPRVSRLLARRAKTAAIGIPPRPESLMKEPELCTRSASCGCPLCQRSVGLARPTFFEPEPAHPPPTAGVCLRRAGCTCAYCLKESQRLPAPVPDEHHPPVRRSFVDDPLLPVSYCRTSVHPPNAHPSQPSSADTQEDGGDDNLSPPRFVISEAPQLRRRPPAQPPPAQPPLAQPPLAQPPPARAKKAGVGRQMQRLGHFLTNDHPDYGAAAGEAGHRSAPAMRRVLERRGREMEALKAAAAAAACKRSGGHSDPPSLRLPPEAPPPQTAWSRRTGG